MNFLLEGLVGFNFYGCIVGIIGIGKIGLVMIWILRGFGMNVLCFDFYLSEVVKEFGVIYCELEMFIC